MPGTEAMRTVYLDACAAIYFIERHPDHIDTLMRRLFRPSGELAVRLVLSELLRMECHLKTPDALHLAAAVQSSCDELWTHDKRLQNAAQGRLALIAFEGVSE